MRSSIYRRRARANDLKVFVRDDVPDTVPGTPSDHELSDSEDEGEPDLPSPKTPEFPPPPVGSPTQQPGEIPPSTTSTDSPQTITPAPSTSTSATPATPDAGVSASPSSSVLDAPSSTVLDTPSSSILVTPSTSSSNAQTSSIDASVTQSALPQNSDAIQAQASQAGGAKPVMSRDGAIALGTVGGLVFMAAIIFIIWKCRRRRNRTGGTPSKFTLFSGFRRMEEPPASGVTNHGLAAKTQSKIMDDLMAAAYAAEDGNASQYGTYVDEKRQPNASVYAADSGQPAPMKHPSWPDPQAPTNRNTNEGKNSLYVNQLLTGFYKGPRADGLAVPSNARMPPPAAPSVAGQTEVTATSESTWRTWGWSQEKKPKENWVEKCIRLGGLK
ncbi:hypothetical protein F4776DRAFT_340330 [Hypoxylon sp. NC0597]|nr:hypothetical protein F4776DRAFT_340330 [Hypoxylon sp. NC0597]